MAASLAAGPLAAQTPPGRPATLERLAECRKVAADAARLACYDQTAAALERAQSQGDIVMMDREQVTQVQRQAFGFSLPSLNLFGRATKAEPIDRFSGKVERAYRQGDGRWVLELEGGAVWLQVDNEPLSRVRPGAPVEIRRASMGSFLVNVAGQRAIRARRTQ